MTNSAASLANADIKKHLLGAIQWASGMVRGGCKAGINSNYQATRITPQQTGNTNQYFGEIGILRTLPESHDDLRRKLENTAKALGIAWPIGTSYAQFIHGLDPKVPAHAAMLAACTVLFRGAGYTAFSGGVPEQPEHAAMKSEYAHVTAPLRRLVDRWTGEICVALCADQPVPGWVRESMDEIPKIMDECDRKAHSYERAIVSMVEAGLVADQVGSEFDGVITDVDDREQTRGVVALSSVAVEGRVTGTGALPLGQPVRVKLVQADIAAGTIAFQLVG